MNFVIKNHGPRSVFDLFSEERACHWCLKYRMGDTPIKLCRGCGITRFCSKECQTAAWPVHKATCTSRSAEKVPPMYASLGCATLSALAEAATDWTVVHKLGLFILATLIIDSYGGADLALNSPRAVVFDIGPAIFESDGTPAMGFALKGVGFVHRDHYPRAAPLWNAQAIAWRDGFLQALRAAPRHPDHIGLVPVMVFIEGTMGYLMMNLPLYRRRGGVDPSAVDQRTAAELKKVMEACTGGINMGTVLRIPTDPDQKMPDLGKLVRQGKRWAWTVHTSRAAGRMPTANMWGSFCAEGFAAYHRLWPYSSLIDRTKPSS